MATKTMMTVEQFAQLATTDPEDYELVEGELIPFPSGTPRHGIIRGKLERLVGSYLDGNRIGKAIGEIDCQLSSNTVRRPDVAIFLGKARLAQIDWDRIPIPFAPDIAVEVLSPNERAMDVRRKVRDYLRAGTKEVWLLDHPMGKSPSTPTAAFVCCRARTRWSRNSFPALPQPLRTSWLIFSDYRYDRSDK